METISVFDDSVFDQLANEHYTLDLTVSQMMHLMRDDEWFNEYDDLEEAIDDISDCLDSLSRLIEKASSINSEFARLYGDTKVTRVRLQW